MDYIAEPLFESLLHFLAVPPLRGESHFSSETLKSLLTYFVTNTATNYVGCKFIENMHASNAVHILGTGIISPSIELAIGNVSKGHLGQAMIVDTLVTGTGVLIWQNLLDGWWFSKPKKVVIKAPSSKLGNSDSASPKLTTTDTSLASSAMPSPTPSLSILRTPSRTPTKTPPQSKTPTASTTTMRSPVDARDKKSNIEEFPMRINNFIKEEPTREPIASSSNPTPSPSRSLGVTIS